MKWFPSERKLKGASGTAYTFFETYYRHPPPPVAGVFAILSATGTVFGEAPNLSEIRVSAPGIGVYYAAVDDPLTRNEWVVDLRAGTINSEAA